MGAKLDETVSGVLKKDPAGVWTVLYNEGQSYVRSRFTIAHELAHFCLHRGNRDNFEDDVFLGPSLPIGWKRSKPICW